MQCTYFYWYLIGKRRSKRLIFFGEYENERKTGQKNWGCFEPWIFEQAPAHNLKFEGD